MIEYFVHQNQLHSILSYVFRFIFFKQKFHLTSSSFIANYGLISSVSQGSINFAIFGNPVIFMNCAFDVLPPIKVRPRADKFTYFVYGIDHPLNQCGGRSRSKREVRHHSLH